MKQPYSRNVRIMKYQTDVTIGYEIEGKRPYRVPILVDYPIVTSVWYFIILNAVGNRI